MSWTADVEDIILSIVVIIGIFGILFFAKGDYGKGFVVLLCAGALIFVRAYVKEKL